MGSRNQFDLLVDVDNDDPSHLIAAAEKKAAASPKPAAPATAPAKLPTKPAPPAQAVREARNYGAPHDGAGRGGPGRGRGGRGGRAGPRRDFGEGDANGFEGGYGGGGFGDGGVARGQDSEGKQAERGRGPRQPYRGGGRRGGYTDGQNGDDYGRPRRAYERHSGTGRGYGMKREGAGRGNWGTVTDEGLAQETVEVVNTEETAATAEEEKKPEDAPQSEVDKDKEGLENEEEEEKEPEDTEMTLEEYEKVLEEKRKALLALKAEERKVEVDKELQSMQQLSVKKDNEEVFIKLGSDKDLKKKEIAERDERAKKSLSINEFLKPAEGERYYNPSGRGRGRGRGRGEHRGFYGGFNGNGGRRHASAPAIEDQAQFPSLGGK
ncbi:RGG repeats nuclear RNA binding protein A-like [Oryza brachyantha]|uniref:Hyaluronan/mRNA-binding protein domain-containing protein n=1 Tax=Oryza brachyantha TaxID=4533 RepID=J3MAA7_ORYBR|nr:RGG repeats nuclear RNA binding protein A-like [Oryza brachyantha]